MTGSLRQPSRLLMAAVVLHHLEEAIAFPRQRGAILQILPFAPPSWAFLAALALVTVAAVLLLAWAGRGPATPDKRLAVQVVAWVFLVNVVVPHVPAAWLLGGYAPGVATAVLVNLPACAWVLLRLRESR